MTDEAHAQAAEVAVARETRLTRLEGDVKKLQHREKDGWEKVQAVTPLVGPMVAGILLAFVSYLLTGSVNNAIQRQQLQLSNVKEMRELLAQLDTADAAAADSAAFTLSAFGRPAVPPLMAALLAGGEVRAPAAERSLRAIGLNDPAAVCDPIRRVIDNRTGRFSWLAHLSTVRLLGDLECREARTSLEAYSRALAEVKTAADVPQFAARVDSDPPLDLSAVEQLQTETVRTLRIIRP
jgi:hypothetical protein